MNRGHHTTLLWNVFISFVGRTTLLKKNLSSFLFFFLLSLFFILKGCHLFFSAASQVKWQNTVHLLQLHNCSGSNFTVIYLLYNHAEFNMIAPMRQGRIMSVNCHEIAQQEGRQIAALLITYWKEENQALILPFLSEDQLLDSADASIWPMDHKAILSHKGKHILLYSFCKSKKKKLKKPCWGFLKD